jgi:hypothetical protein
MPPLQIGNIYACRAFGMHGCAGKSAVPRISDVMLFRTSGLLGSPTDNSNCFLIKLDYHTHVHDAQVLSGA